MSEDGLPKLVASRPAQSDVVAYLDARPDSAAVTDKYGRLPLHWAVTNQAGAEVVTLLQEAHKEGAAVADKHGRLPLRLAVEKHGKWLVRRK